MSAETRLPMRFVDLPGGWTAGRLALLENLPGVRHAFSTRRGPHGGDLGRMHPCGLDNRRALARAIGAECCAWADQVHGDRVIDADQALAGPVEADALATAREGVAVLGLSADCPIVLVADAVRGAVGMAHASWRSTVQRITARLIEFMRDSYGCRPADMQAGIGPSAGPQRYEVGPDVLDAALSALGGEAEQFFLRREDKTYFDLWAANVDQLTQAGLSPHNVSVAGVCTIGDERFYSYRRQGARAGRGGGIIARV